MPNKLKIIIGVMACFIFGLYGMAYYAKHDQEARNLKVYNESMSRGIESTPEDDAKWEVRMAKARATIKHNTDISTIKSMCRSRMQDGKDVGEFADKQDLPLIGVAKRLTRFTEADCQRWINNYNRTGKLPL
jgi:hypothetical protein